MKKFEVHFTKVFDRAEEIAILSCQKKKKIGKCINFIFVELNLCV